MQLLLDPRGITDVLLDIVLRRRQINTNDAGRVLGQDHHRAKLDDHGCDLIRAARGRETARDVAARFEVSVHTVFSIWQGRRRSR